MALSFGWLSRLCGFGGFGGGLALVFGESPHAGGADLHPNLAAVDFETGTLKIRLPNFVRLLLGEGNAVAELLSFSADVAGVCHQ